MNVSDLTALAAANAKLPENAFFAYNNIEVIEFETHPGNIIELIDGTLISAAWIRVDAISFHFD